MTQPITKTNGSFKATHPTLHFTAEDRMEGLCDPLLSPPLCLPKNYLQKKNPSSSDMESHLTLTLASFLDFESPSILLQEREPGFVGLYWVSEPSPLYKLS